MTSQIQPGNADRVPARGSGAWATRVARPCARWLAALSPAGYLYAVIIAVLSLTFCNTLFCTLSYDIGGRPVAMVGDPNDRLADLVKYSLSFRTITSGIDKTPQFLTWSRQYQWYYEVPRYGGSENLARGYITHFHSPPFATLLFLLCAVFIVWSGSPSLAVALFFAAYLLSVWAMIWIGIPPERRTKATVAVVWFGCLLTYPALLLFSRASYINAGFTAIALLAFLLSAFVRRQIGFFALLALAVAINVRPNAVIFAVAVPLVLGLRRSWKPLLVLFALASAICAASYVGARHLDAEYTFANFLAGLRVYTALYVVGPLGDAGNSSLLALIKNLDAMWYLAIPVPKLMLMFDLYSFLLVVVVGWGWWRRSVARPPREKVGGERAISATEHPSRHAGLPPAMTAFFLVSLYCLVTPVFADYHLLAFLAPLLIVYLNYEDWAEHWRTLAVVTAVCILLLSPKEYLAIHGVSLQTVFNPALLFAATLWLATREGTPSSSDEDIKLSMATGLPRGVQPLARSTAKQG